MTPFISSAQDYYVLHAIVIGNDTFPIVYLKKIHIISKRVFKNAKEELRYKKLKRDVLKVYPYSQLAVVTLKKINNNLALLKTRKQKKKYMKKMEKELKSNFKDPLKNLTVTQGKILVKLIERETGTDCYHLIKELKSSFSAFYWQAVGSFLGYDLKIEYDPQLDKDIESIMSVIEE